MSTVTLAAPPAPSPARSRRPGRPLPASLSRAPDLGDVTLADYSESDSSSTSSRAWTPRCAPLRCAASTKPPPTSMGSGSSAFRAIFPSHRCVFVPRRTSPACRALPKCGIPRSATATDQNHRRSARRPVRAGGRGAGRRWNGAPRAARPRNQGRTRLRRRPGRLRLTRPPGGSRPETIARSRASVGSPLPDKLRPRFFRAPPTLLTV